MTKSELINVLADEQDHLPYPDVEAAVRQVIECMSAALATGERIEIRGFGSFSLHFRPPRIGRNPKTGEAVALDGRHAPYFKPGKDLRERANAAFSGPADRPAAPTPPYVTETQIALVAAPDKPAPKRDPQEVSELALAMASRGEPLAAIRAAVLEAGGQALDPKTWGQVLRTRRKTAQG
jgi:integration host factor subunit beta